MKIKPEYEDEMIDKMISDLEDCLSKIQNIDFSCALSNYDDVANFADCYSDSREDNVHTAYKILDNLYDVLIYIKHKKEIK